MKKIDNFTSNLITKSQLIANNFTYPIFVINGKNKADLIASSVILEVEGIHYLVTASHVIETVNKYDSLFYIIVNRKFIPIESVFFVSKNSNLNASNEPGSDNFDIAFTELDIEIVNSNNISAVDKTKISLTTLSKSPYISFIHGFPNSRNKQSKFLWKTGSYDMQPYAYVVDIKFGKDVNWEKLNKTQNMHTCMDYKRKKVMHAPTHPSGMSGGGLWVIPSRKQPNSLYLDSIFIEYHKSDDVTFSTKISQVLEYIKKVQINEKSKVGSSKDNYIKLLT